MIRHKLAIIIPAYKAEYLEETLSSLCEQSDSRFTVYIGDDCSPYDLKSIVDKFMDKMSIIYHRYDANMGSVSLTQQWERCVSLSHEEWIWLFSDDDIIEKNAIQTFYESVDEDCLLYKFHTKVIDEFGHLNPYYRRFDQVNKVEGYISSADFIYHRLDGQGYRSFAVEYVFHRSLFQKIGFIDFPLAWNSDDATWLAYSLDNGNRIKVLDTNVYWRLSKSNISSDTKSHKIILQKVDASILYIGWLYEMVVTQQLVIERSMVLKWFSIQIGIFMPHITIKDFYSLLSRLPYSYSSAVIFFYFLRYVKLQGIKRDLQLALKFKK